jgi:serine/threonine protein kinase
VFTNEELKAITEDPAYQVFIRTALVSSTVLFVGVSADDIAVGGHLEFLSRAGISQGPHFWLTDRVDLQTDRWAEAAGVLAIRYRVVGGDHTELDEALDDLATFIPQEDLAEPQPVMPAVALPVVDLKEPEELVRDDAETIRLVLNRVAVDILKDDSAESHQRFADFCDKYDEAIHRAWYTSARAGKNRLLGFELLSEEKQGAFGKVYKAQGASGDHLAIKVLHNEIRSDQDLLHSFRRGVRSMRILSERSVKGTVPYLQASEIPAFVVMPWIEGANLCDAVASRQLESWADKLSTCVELVGIIREAHALPERVLHRDLRPSNIMIEGLFTGDRHVVVLDFDLSWHLGGHEKSVIHGSSLAGYLAPEQIQRIPGASTRHSAVDSFGLGMTLYFIVAGRDPVPDQHLHSEWAGTVASAAQRYVATNWTSLPQRFARLVLAATRHNQQDRWDVSQIYGELERLRAADSCPTEVRSADMLAEEIAARTTTFRDYTWDEDQKSARSSTASGMLFELSGDDSRNELILSMSSEQIKTAGKRAERADASSKAARDILTKSGWRIESFDTSKGSVSIVGSKSSGEGSLYMDACVRSVDRAAGELV